MWLSLAGLLSAPGYAVLTQVIFCCGLLMLPQNDRVMCLESQWGALVIFFCFFCFPPNKEWVLWKVFCYSSCSLWFGFWEAFEFNILDNAKQFLHLGTVTKRRYNDCRHLVLAFLLKLLWLTVGAAWKEAYETRNCKIRTKVWTNEHVHYIKIRTSGCLWIFFFLTLCWQLRGIQKQLGGLAVFDACVFTHCFRGLNPFSVSSPSATFGPAFLDAVLSLF